MKLASQIPEMENKIFVLPNPVDGQKFYPASKPEDLIRKYGLSGYSIILTVARLAKTEQYKGYDKVIEALPLVLQKNPRVKYFLIGKGDDEKRVRDLIGKNNLRENVIISGGLTDEELVKYYNLCDLFVMPSKGEGFGFVFLEALACSKPVISGNQDASPEPLLGGELGLLVNPDNTKEISDAIMKILDKKAPSKILDGQYLRKKVLEAYGLDKFKEKTKIALLS